MCRFSFAHFVAVLVALSAMCWSLPALAWSCNCHSGPAGETCYSPCPWELPDTSSPGCSPGWVLSKNGGCRPIDSVECGGGFCSQGSYCGSRDKCVRNGDVDCGDGRSCQQGTYCGRDT